MRIISQDGTLNFPYEMTALLVSENYIQAVFACGMQKDACVIAMYSTQDKLKDALDMLDKTYASGWDVTFRFPADSK